MMRLCKYRQPTQSNPSNIPGTYDDYIKLYRYCMQDVEAERAIDKALRDLTPKEQQIWLLDQKINMRGVRIDRPAVFAALEHLSILKEHFVDTVKTLTNGQVTALTKVQQLREWCNANGEPMVTFDKKAVKEKLEDPLMDDNVRALLEARQEAGKSSTAKFNMMLTMSNEQDWRARGNLRYHGASTGRWAGMGIQLHNLAKGVKIDDVCAAVDEMRAVSTSALQALHPKTMQWMSSLIRSMIIPSEGSEFQVADYNAIEARVILWLAGEQEALENFDNGLGIYRDMASTIYNKTPEDITDDERQLGKTIILGGGFGMGFFKFLCTCKDWGIKLPSEMVKQVIARDYDNLKWRVDKFFEDPKNKAKLAEAGLDINENGHELMFANQIVSSYRSRFPKVPQFWNLIEQTAIYATKNKNEIVPCGGKLHWMSDGEFLWLRLPSGRKLAYYAPQVRETMKFGKPAEVLSFMAVGMNNKWVRQYTYGGMLAENATQAAARDIMAEAMLRVEANGYPVVLTIHDEIISEATNGTNKEFCDLLSIRPEWATDLPLKVAGWSGRRYKKG
jgi:DNA polymerase